MRRILLAFTFFLAFVKINAQSIYFPPLTGNAWETLSPDSLGWCDEKILELYDLLETNDTKAFLLLKNGRIVLEKYFGTFTQDSVWYWASAGKSMTAMLVGIAQQEGLLDINDKTSDYLGAGWTTCPPEKEDLIKVWNQLTMTSGLDDGVDAYCTLDTCLVYKADAGTRWAYHNAPYTLLDQVMESATGQNFNLFFNQRITQKTGISGLWVKVDYNNVLWSKARSMARYGILVQNGGTWNSTPVLNDPSYFQAMVTPSQNINQSYGYLWWLNGQPTYKLPGLQINFSGPLFPAAPPDMISALGKNGQYLNVVPSQGIVMVRMGNPPGTSLEVPVVFNNDIWMKINDLGCETSSIEQQEQTELTLQIFPNPSNGHVEIFGNGLEGDFTVNIFDTVGRLVLSTQNERDLDVSQLGTGLFNAVVQKDGQLWTGRFFVNN